MASTDCESSARCPRCCRWRSPARCGAPFESRATATGRCSSRCCVRAPRCSSTSAPFSASLRTTSSPTAAPKSGRAPRSARKPDHEAAVCRGAAAAVCGTLLVQVVLDDVLAAASAAVYALYIAQRMDMVRISIPVTGSILDVDGQMHANVLAFLESLHPTPVRLRNVEGNQLWMLKQFARNVTVDRTASNIGAKFSARGIKALLAVTVVLFDVLEAFVAEQVDILRECSDVEQRSRGWRALPLRCASPRGTVDAIAGRRRGPSTPSRSALVPRCEVDIRSAARSRKSPLCGTRWRPRTRASSVQAECGFRGPATRRSCRPTRCETQVHLFSATTPAPCAWQTPTARCPSYARPTPPEAASPPPPPPPPSPAATPGSRRIPRSGRSCRSRR